MDRCTGIPNKVDDEYLTKYYFPPALSMYPHNLYTYSQNDSISVFFPLLEPLHCREEWSRDSGDTPTLNEGDGVR